jgi:hypothetical protein
MVHESLVPLRNFFLFLLMSGKIKIHQLDPIFFNVKCLQKEDFSSLKIKGELNPLTLEPKAKNSLHPEDLQEIEDIFLQLSHYLDKDVFDVGVVDYKLIEDVIFGKRYFPKERR